jgi:histidyl-tRNA synthetase
VTADAEILVIALSLMEKLTIPNYLCRINDLAILRTFLEENHYDIDQQNKIFGVIDKIASLLRKVEIGAITELTADDFIEDYYAAMTELKIDRDLIEKLEPMLTLVGTPAGILEKLKTNFAGNPKTLEMIEKSSIHAVCELVQAAGYEKFVMDCGIARGLDYYTNIVFEIDVPLLGKEKQVCGGGRYNRLISEFGGENTPATGFAFGFDRLLIILERLGKITPRPYRSQVYIAAKAECRTEAMKIAQQLRQGGIPTEVDLMDRSFKNVSKFVNSINVPFMIFIGPQEVKSGKLTLKDFRTETQYNEKSLDEIIAILKK